VAIDKVGADYHEELCKEVARWSSTADRVRAVLSAIAAAHPAAYREAVVGTTLAARLRRQAHRLAHFLADRDARLPPPPIEGRSWTREHWCLHHGIDPKVLQRAAERYERDTAFRADVDAKAAQWRDANARRST
jgi:hypothetical protein